MQTRLAFNSGEFSPEMAYRSDMDQHGRACEKLENWEVSQMGGLKRRRGMRRLSRAASARSRLIPYIYSYAPDENQRFLVEIGESVVKVLSYEGVQLASFNEISAGVKINYSPRNCYYKQVNNLLIITALDTPPMVLKRDSQSNWVFERWYFKQNMWRYNYEVRDYSIIIGRSGETYTVQFANDEDKAERFLEEGETDELRASFWTEPQEAIMSSEKLRANIRDGSILPDAANPGDKFAVSTESSVKYFVCTQDWNDRNYYMPSLDSPANYPNNFIQAESSEGFEDVTQVYSIHDVAPGGVISKGSKIAIKSGYWEYYTCIKSFNRSQEGASSTASFSDFPTYFIRGLAVGEALPCRGEWSFYCSGVWFGSYEVRRNYDTSELNENWERRGESFSRLEAASNIMPTGSESDEICYLRLFLTRSKKMSDTVSEDELAGGFPQDSCGNRLLVSSYKHDLILSCAKKNDKMQWSSAEKVVIDWGKKRDIKDWSWAAFSKRYGYPLLCEIYNKRLVFASTEDQPQTVWMSRTDDLNNFSTTGSTETAAMSLTLNTTSQNPICWLHSQSYRLMLGTSEAEYSISAGQSQAGISNTNAQIEDHSHVGSDGVAVLALNDTALFVERGAGRVYSLQYSFQIDGYTSQDISIFAPHIAKEHQGICEMSCIRKPDTVGLFVLGDGQLALCTYNKLHEINAWHRWVTEGRIISVCGMPNGTENDKIFLIVERGGEPWIEVVDSKSSYSDNGLDYSSLLVVNALMDYRQGFFEQRESRPNYLCLGEDFRVNGDNILVSDDGGQTWVRPPHAGDKVLRKGWNKQFTPSGYKYEVKPAVKVTGNQGIHILGLRA